MLSDQRPATSDQRPATSDQRPATSDQRPATSNGVIVSQNGRCLFKYYDEAGNLIPNVSPEDIPGLTVKFIDETSELELHRPHSFVKTSIIVGKKCRVVILGNASVKLSLKIITENQNEVHIGRNFNIRSAELVCRSEPGINIWIGDDFLGSSQILFRTSDAHTIYSLETKKPLNAPKSGIRVGNHVWMGRCVTLLKDAVVPNDCIVSFGAVVTRKAFPSNAVIGGVPAKVIKTGVNWSGLNTFKYQRKFASEFLEVSERESNNHSGDAHIYLEGGEVKCFQVTSRAVNPCGHVVDIQQTVEAANVKEAINVMTGELAEYGFSAIVISAVYELNRPKE